MISRIFISGFMASGKSTVGRKLAELLHFRFLDLDREIEAVEGRSIREIFADEGEGYFRAQEKNVLLSLVAMDDVVISLGGGAVTDIVTQNLLLESGLVVFLSARVDTLTRRLLGSGLNRPLILDATGKKLGPEAMSAKIETILGERMVFYSMAQFTVRVDERSTPEIAAEIASYLTRQHS